MGGLLKTRTSRSTAIQKPKQSRNSTFALMNPSPPITGLQARTTRTPIFSLADCFRPPGHRAPAANCRILRSLTMLQATYSPEDNKLRLYASSRLDAETYARIKAVGFIWAPKQDLFVAPMWTPARADLLIELCGEIE